MIDRENRPYTDEANAHDAGSESDGEQLAMLAQTGQKFFLRASMESPSSVVAQGARIAGYCQEAGIENPYILAIALESNQSLVNQIIAKAQRVHEVRGKGPLEIDYDHAVRVIQGGFSYAQACMILEPHDLNLITGRFYKRHIVKRGDEFGLRQRAEALIEQKQDELDVIEYNKFRREANTSGYKTSLDQSDITLKPGIVQKIKRYIPKRKSQ